MSEHKLDRKTEAVFAIVVTSDSRGVKEDETGRMAKELIEKAGHSVSEHILIPNDEEKIRDEVSRLLNTTAQVIITSGGTGMGSKDKTVAAVSSLLEKDLPGFGELFRRMSYDQVGPAAIMSRATAGVAKHKLVFCLPGSKNAVSLALEKIILPSVGHMLWELSR